LAQRSGRREVPEKRGYRQRAGNQTFQAHEPKNFRNITSQR
jgi:hypothetical protein